MTRRSLELVLLCVAAPLVVLLFAMIALNQGQPLNFDTLGVPLGIFVAFIIAHLAVRRFAPRADPALLPIVFALSSIGIAFVTRVSIDSGSPGAALNQVIWLFLGVVCMVVVLAVVRNIDKLAHFKYTFMIIGFLLLLSPLVPGLGQEINGSRIWIGIPHVLSFQPGEIAKLAIVLFLAGYLAQNREMLSVFTWRVGPFHLPDIRILLPLLFMWGISLVIVVFEKDLGSAIVFFFVFIVMLYATTGKKFFLIGGLILIVLGAIGAYLAFGHVQVRVNTWLHPFSDPQNTGYQLTQSLYSLADGGLFGQGVGKGLAGGGNGVPAIPVAESDFIFTVIAEEIGLLGAAGMLLLFLCFAVRGFVTAARAKSDVSSFVAVGLTTMVVLQAFIIVGGVTRLIPLTGITLPFISQGGSSLLASFIAVGLLLRCGDEATGVSTEVISATTSLHVNSVLGRISLGKRLTHSMLLCSALFALLVGNLTLIMVVQAPTYQNMPGNNHTLAKESHSQRGTISTYDGIVLAKSVVDKDGTYDRQYPAGDLASHVVGYASPQFGTAGIESAYNTTLQGQKNYASWTDVLDAMAGISKPGNDVTLTINSKIQQAAQDALKGAKGACVVMDPDTGAVLAMASSPTYNAADVDKLLTASSADPSSGDGALINRAIHALYAPGSTFKMVTLAAALQDGTVDENTVFPAPGTMTIGNASVSNFEHTNYGSLSVARATALSSNTVFGQIGEELGPDKLVAGAEQFGFNKQIDFPLVMYTALMPNPKDMTQWETAWAAAGEPVGQNKTADHPSPNGPQTTVMQMALVGSAIADDGALMQPYLVDGIYSPDGKRSFTAQPSLLMQAINKDIAQRERKVLVGVVNNGTGSAAAIPGVQVAGKTGTAEKQNSNNSWFVGMAPADKPKVVVSLLIEDGAEGIATQKAQNVLKEGLQIQGVL